MNDYNSNEFDIVKDSSVFILNEVKKPKYKPKKNIHTLQDIRRKMEKIKRRMEVTDVVIPEGVTSINNSWFKKYPHLRSVQLPNSLIEIKPNTFENCNLDTIIIPQNVKVCENLFSNQIPNNLKVILPENTLFINNVKEDNQTYTQYRYNNN